LPKHVWENIPPASFPLAEQNLKPIGSGPYKFKNIQKDNAGKIKKIELSEFSDYFSGRPFIDTLAFSFYKDEATAISAFNNGEVDGISLVSAGNISNLKADFNLNKFILPRYFAVFFNQDMNKALADKNVRQALSLAVNKKEFVEKIINGQGVEINSPLPRFIFNKDDSNTSGIEPIQDFDIEKAKNILESNGWLFAENGTTSVSARQKTVKKDKGQETLMLEISLLTVDWPELVATANYLKSSWENIGAKVNVIIKQPTEIQELIRTRRYEALLFGQILGADPDPFAFWHSSQTKDPGLNLALYANKDVDKLLETIRQETDPQKKIAEFDQFNKLVAQDFPALFLYSPTYLYPTSPRIKGIELKNSNSPSARFVGIEKWYIKTKRHWK
jgi:peptide/nickel transport system substrate-binding protein